VDWCSTSYELFYRFDTRNDDSDDEWYVIYVHWSIGWYKLYIYSDVSWSGRNRRFDNVIIREHASAGGCHRAYGF
jgi:hypothetical protein